ASRRARRGAVAARPSPRIGGIHRDLGLPHRFCSRLRSRRRGSARTHGMGLPDRDIAQAAGFIAPPGYSRNRPESTLLYRLVAEHYPKFRDRRAAEERSLPRYVEDEFEAYLKCGRLEHGFLRVKCESCQAEKLVAFSCKRRGFCPSCGARRMAETAALLVDDVLPRQPVRQWVLSLPFALRYLLATRPEVVTQVLGIVYRAISGHLIRKAGLTRASGVTGADFGGAQSAGATDRGADRPLARALGAHCTRYRERVSDVRSGRGGADQQSARGLDHVPDRDGAKRRAESVHAADAAGRARWRAPGGGRKLRLFAACGHRGEGLAT